MRSSNEATGSARGVCRDTACGTSRDGTDRQGGRCPSAGAAFKQRLSGLGWVEGRNIRFEDRWAEDDDRRYTALAAELAALPVDAILTWSTPAALAAKQATTKIPIVMCAIADPVAVGVVTGLARPGSNITGFSS